MKTAALLALAFAGSLSADPIWSYTFSEPNGIGFIIWHEGPVVPINGVYGLPGDQLHWCWPGSVSWYCSIGGFELRPTGLEAVLSRQMNSEKPPDVPEMADRILFVGAALNVTGDYFTTFGGGQYTLKISDDPRDLAPEPGTWALLGFGLLGICYATVKQKKAQLSPGLGASP